MEFHIKLQQLRKQAGLTQEELAQQLYVSRAAVSKWESGRGYPNIDSLKAIADFFSVTVDQLLSSDEALTLAEHDGKARLERTRALIWGLMDLCMGLLLILPLFADRSQTVIRAVSLWQLEGAAPWMKGSLCAVILASMTIGIITLATRRYARLSLVCGGLAVLLPVLTLHPYAAVFALVLLAVKVFFLLRQP